eukprot:gene4808-5876_t
MGAAAVLGLDVERLAHQFNLEQPKCMDWGWLLEELGISGGGGSPQSSPREEARRSANWSMVHQKVAGPHNLQRTLDTLEKHKQVEALETSMGQSSWGSFSNLPAVLELQAERTVAKEGLIERLMASHRHPPLSAEPRTDPGEAEHLPPPPTSPTQQAASKVAVSAPLPMVARPASAGAPGGRDATLGVGAGTGGKSPLPSGARAPADVVGERRGAAEGGVRASTDQGAAQRICLTCRLGHEGAGCAPLKPRFIPAATPTTPAQKQAPPPPPPSQPPTKSAAPKGKSGRYVPTKVASPAERMGPGLLRGPARKLSGRRSATPLDPTAPEVPQEDRKVQARWEKHAALGGVGPAAVPRVTVQEKRLQRRLQQTQAQVEKASSKPKTLAETMEAQAKAKQGVRVELPWRRGERPGGQAVLPDGVAAVDRPANIRDTVDIHTEESLHAAVADAGWLGEQLPPPAWDGERGSEVQAGNDGLPWGGASDAQDDAWTEELLMSPASLASVGPAEAALLSEDIVSVEQSSVDAQGQPGISRPEAIAEAAAPGPAASEPKPRKDLTARIVRPESGRLPITVARPALRVERTKPEVRTQQAAENPRTSKEKRATVKGVQTPSGQESRAQQEKLWAGEEIYGQRFPQTSGRGAVRVVVEAGGGRGEVVAFHKSHPLQGPRRNWDGTSARARTTVFEHIPGCQVCQNQFEHYQLPNGRFAHFYDSGAALYLAGTRPLEPPPPRSTTLALLGLAALPPTSFLLLPLVYPGPDSPPAPLRLVPRLSPPPILGNTFPSQQDPSEGPGRCPLELHAIARSLPVLYNDEPTPDGNNPEDAAASGAASPDLAALGSDGSLGGLSRSGGGYSPKPARGRRRRKNAPSSSSSSEELFKLEGTLWGRRRLTADSKSLWDPPEMDLRILGMDWDRLCRKARFMQMVKGWAKGGQKAAEGEALVAIRAVAEKCWVTIGTAFEFYSGIGTGDVDVLQANMCSQAGLGGVQMLCPCYPVPVAQLLEESKITGDFRGAVRRADADRCFIAANQEDTRGTGTTEEDEANPDKGLLQYEFIEYLIRVALITFKADTTSGFQPPYDKRTGWHTEQSHECTALCAVPNMLDVVQQVVLVNTEDFVMER